MSLDGAVDSQGSDVRPIDKLIEERHIRFRAKKERKVTRNGSKSSWTNGDDSENGIDLMNSMDDSQMMAMLGINDFHGDSVLSSYFQREDVCAACGTVHARPDLLDMYFACRACHAILRPPKVLRDEYKGVPQKVPLEIIFATYGDAGDERNAVDVTAKCIQKLNESDNRDRIGFRPPMRLDEFFLGHTVPYSSKDKVEKQLRMRYRIDKVFATLILNFSPQHTVLKPFLLIIPSDLTSPTSFKPRYLRLFRGTYGHPKGMSSTGRMAYDVLEILQSQVDQAGGSFLSINSSTELSPILGDPCPGYVKELCLQYEVCGRAGTATYSEVRGFLRKRVLIQTSPTVKPLIFVVSATYGLTPTGRKQQLDWINSQLSKIQYLEHTKRQGVVLTGKEVVFLKSKASLLGYRDTLSKASTCFIDVRAKLQLLCDQASNGGTHFLLNKDTFDPNAYFGNPYPAGVDLHLKLLECQLDCQGHDSERMTETQDMQDTGYMRNFITAKNSRFSVLVEDELHQPLQTAGESAATPRYRGRMKESLEFNTGYSSPIIVVTRATYGEIGSESDSRDMSKCIDVTSEVQNKVVGRMLVIEQSEDLNKLFMKDPSPGKRKKLRIEYVTRGITGNLRVRVADDKLVASIELGYPPVPPPDDDDVIIN